MVTSTPNLLRVSVIGFCTLIGCKIARSALTHAGTTTSAAPFDAGCAPSSTVSSIASMAPVASADAAREAHDAADATLDAAQTPLPQGFREQDWEIIAGKWLFAEDGSVECKGGQLESAIVLKDHWFKDVHVRVEANFDQTNASAGLIVRVRGTDRYPLMTSYYQFEWYTPGTHHDKRLSIMSKEAPTFWVQIVSPMYPRPPVHFWFPLEFEARGVAFHAIANHKWVLDGKDGKLQRPGRIGLHVYQPVAVKFRNFTYESLDSELSSEKK